MDPEPRIPTAAEPNLGPNPRPEAADPVPAALRPAPVPPLPPRRRRGSRCLPPPRDGRGPKRSPEPERSREDPPAGKKPPLRRSSSVLNRLRWDPRAEPSEVTVEYRDRFAGVVERPLSDFFPGPLCDAGPGDLAVPEHRIVRIRYRGRCVWDRERRVDRVFGSAGGEGTLRDVLRELGDGGH